MLSKIYLTKEMLEVYKVKDGKENELDNLSRVNIFVGANNSGKSRFLRGLFVDEDFHYEIDFITTFDVIKILEIATDTFNTRFRTIRTSDSANAESILKKILTYSEKMSFKDNPIKNLEELLTEGEYLIDNLPANSDTRSIVISIVNPARESVKDLINDDILYYPCERFYIPILRGLRHVGYNKSEIKLPITSEDSNEEEKEIQIQLKNHREDVYWKRTKDEYFKKIEIETNRIFTGLNLYDDLVAKLLGDRADREQVREFEDFLSTTFFSGRKVNLIPKMKDGIVHVAIGDFEDPVHELGDGIQSIIALTYPMFFNQGKEMVFFIEEPEHCLHPGFQRIFMDVLLSDEFKSFQYFITTHSNHLLDMTLDEKQVSIYTFQKNPPNKKFKGKPTFTIENVDNANTDILQLLGVRTSSVFLTNCTIWVEGITDRLYIQRYLEVYQDQLTKINKKNLESNPNATKLLKPIYKEDLHFSFVEYGGSNITHWSFLEDKNSNTNTIDVKRLCAKLFLISDQDGAGLVNNSEETQRNAAKKERHKKLQKNLKNRYQCLPVREIENLLSPPILIKIIQAYEKNSEIEIPELKYADYKLEPLGKYIDEVLLNQKSKKRRYAEKSGTITDKVNFARKAIQAIEIFEDLSPDAKALVKKIYEFVKFHNAGEAANAES